MGGENDTIRDMFGQETTLEDAFSSQDAATFAVLSKEVITIHGNNNDNDNTNNDDDNDNTNDTDNDSLQSSAAICAASRMVATQRGGELGRPELHK